MGTKWEAYSQTMLKILVPEWERVVIDGRRNWSPTQFIGSVVDRDVDYIVHVDEDCFVQSRDALQYLIAALDNDKNLVAAGIPDGGYYYRNHNPAALNLFFVVFRTEALRNAWEERERWSTYCFVDLFADEVLRQCPKLDKTRINWDEGEPYYPLFWSLLYQGGRFLYLTEELNRQRWSSKVLLPSGGVLAEHMWYLRQWFSSEVMPGHDISNNERYKLIESQFLTDATLPFRFVLLSQHFKRLWRRFFGRITELLVR